MDLITKLEVSDVDGYDWNWIAKYEDEIVDELTQAYTTAFTTELATLPEVTVQRLAAEWARVQSGELIGHVSGATKGRVGDIIAKAVQEGASIQSTTKQIRDDYIFSKQRARVVARTETAFALGQGQKGAAIAQGRDEKRWTTSGDIDDVCLENEAAGWIAIADPFPSEHDTVPAHPNCRCVVRYRTKALSEDEATVVSPLSSELIQQSISRIEDFRCVGCNRLLGRQVVADTRIMCRHCKSERTA
tara:strand:+ start:97 stop:834 length:738 start_codon:yes stop_codon:yes gene_type:complete